MLELEKPRSAQVLTVDHVIEATAGVEALHKRKIVTDQQVEPLRRAIVDKFKSKVIDNTVAPRKLANLARAVERNEITISSARQSVKRLIEEPKYSIDSAYQETVERADLEHGVEQVAIRLTSKLDDLKERGILLSEKTSKVLAELIKAIRRHA